VIESYTQMVAWTSPGTAARVLLMYPSTIRESCHLGSNPKSCNRFHSLAHIAPQESQRRGQITERRLRAPNGEFLRDVEYIFPEELALAGYSTSQNRANYLIYRLLLLNAYREKTRRSSDGCEARPLQCLPRRRQL